MNPEAKAKLDEILENGASSVTDEDRVFLHARRSYLTKEQREEFGITEDAPSPQPEDSETLAGEATDNDNDEDVDADAEAKPAKKPVKK